MTAWTTRVIYEEPGQHYGPEHYGPRCTRCNMRMLQTLVDAEPHHTTHPACDEVS